VPFLSRGIRPANTVAEIASRIDTGLCASNSSRREGYSAERWRTASRTER
jgi:hypothetical protein